MLFQELIFWSLAVCSVGSAIGVVLVRDIFRSALLLVLVFLTVAGEFFLLAAEFLGVVQILIYAGAISILIIFALMLTRDPQQGNVPNRLQLPAAMLVALLASALIFVFLQTDWNLVEGLTKSDDVISRAYSETSFKLARLLLTHYAVAFGAAGVILLASIIGALSLVRER